MSKIAHFKNQFFRHPTKLATNNAGLAPYPKAGLEIIKNWAQRFHEEGVHCDAEAVMQTQVVRKKLSTFLNCETSELAFTQSTANAISQVAFGIKLQPQDEIIIWGARVFFKLLSLVARGRTCAGEIGDGGNPQRLANSG